MTTDQNEVWGIMTLMATTGGSNGHTWLDFNGKDGRVLDWFDAPWRNKYKEFQVNYERDKAHRYKYPAQYPLAGKSIIITKKQRLLIDMYNQNKNAQGDQAYVKNTSWGYLHNCVDYATGAWTFITGSKVYSEYFGRSPKNLFKTLSPIQNFIPIVIPSQ